MEEIVKRFARLTGMTPEEAAEWRYLCAGADEELAGLLKKEEDRASERFYAACAALAFYRYTLAASGEESFSAGDVKITRREASRGAEQLWQQARRAAADLFRDQDFVFRRTAL